MKLFPLIPAMESIDFQSTMFFDELVALYTEGKKIGKDITSSGKFCERIDSVIRHHTNMNAKTFNGGSWYIMLPETDGGNVLMKAMREQFGINHTSGTIFDSMSKYKDADGLLRGRVDLKNAKVHGIFEKFAMVICVDLDALIKNKLSPEECAAVTLHEVGHSFTFFEYSSRVISTNFALSAMNQKLMNPTTQPEREIIFGEVKRFLKLKELNVNLLANVPDTTMVDLVIVNTAVSQSRSELGSDIYDTVGFEYLSDQFASRLGAGRYIVTALDKIVSGNMSRRTPMVYYTLEAIKVLGVVGGIAMTGGAATAGIYMAIFFLGYSAVDSSDTSPLNTTYDRLDVRFKRVRNQLVERLKENDLPPEVVKSVRTDIVVVDEILKHYHLDRLGLWNTIMSKISPKLRKGLSQQRLQNELENLATNDLFIKAAELRLDNDA